MGENILKLTKNEKKFLNAILKQGYMSDTDLCRETGLTKSTCSRIRKRLENDLISEYIPIIDLHKAGINVFLVLTFQWTSFDDEQLTKRVFSELKNDPKVVFLAHGEGSISSTVAFIAFKDLENYHTYLRDFRKRYGKHLQNINTLLLPSREVIKNDFTEVISLAIGE